MIDGQKIITLDEFLDLKRRELEQFAEGHKARHAQNPDEYPMDMKALCWVGEFSMSKPRIIDPDAKAEARS